MRCVVPLPRSPLVPTPRRCQDVEAHAASVQDKDAALLALRAEGEALSRKQVRARAALPARATAEYVRRAERGGGCCTQAAGGAQRHRNAA